MIKLMTLFLVFFIQPTDLISVDENSAWIKKATKQTEKHFKQKAHLSHFEAKQLFHNSTNSTLYLVKNEQDDELGIAAISLVSGCVVGGCSIANTNETRFEQFYLLSIYNNEKELIKLLVLDYPGDYGYEISAKWWLKQFLGNNSKKHIYRKDIDAVSGATVSAQSVVNEVNILNRLIRTLVISE